MAQVPRASDTRAAGALRGHLINYRVPEWRRFLAALPRGRPPCDGRL